MNRPAVAANVAFLPPSAPATRRRICHADGDRDSGSTWRIVATIDLPRAPTLSPMTYMYQGKRHIVPAIGGSTNAGLVAFTLRAVEARD